MNKNFNRFGLGALQTFFATDDTPGGGGGNEGDENPTTKTKDVDLVVESALVALRTKHGDDAGVARYLVKRNHSLQTSKDKAETALKQAQEQKPDETTQQLTDSERAELDAYRALGKTDELKTELDAGRVSRRNEEVAEFARVQKLKNNALLKSLVGDAGFEFEGEGEARKVKSIKTKDGKSLSFEDFAKANPALTDALPSLQIEAPGQQQQQSQQPGAWVAQGQQNGGVVNGQQQAPPKPAAYTM
jgi:vacuolar-type H+-ATPase subunit I/STV1